jgi:hypothetical protein
MLFMAFVILSTPFHGNRQYEKLDITRSANYIKPHDLLHQRTLAPFL